MTRCPVCMYPELPYPAADYHICPCCGTEFGNDDAYQTHAELREVWMRNGAQWFFGNPQEGWNPDQQLLNAGINYFVSPSSQETVGTDPGSRVGDTEDVLESLIVA